MALYQLSSQVSQQSFCWWLRVFSRCIWLLVPFFFFKMTTQDSSGFLSVYIVWFLLLMLAATYYVFLFSQLWCRQVVLNILRKIALLSWLKSWSMLPELVNTLSSNVGTEMKPKNHVFWRTIESAKVTS